MYVIDASVHVADARLREPHHAEARELLARIAAEGQAVCLPTIVIAEVAAAISRGTGQPILARRLTATLLRVPHFQFVSVDDALRTSPSHHHGPHTRRGTGQDRSIDRLRPALLICRFADSLIRSFVHS